MCVYVSVCVCASHLVKEGERAHVYACVRVCGCFVLFFLLGISGCGVHGGSPPRRKMNRSGKGYATVQTV